MTNEGAEKMMAEAKAELAEDEKPVMYEIRSTVRARHNRSLRAAVPTNNRHRFKQHVLTDQRRLVRSRPLKVTELEVYQNLPELKAKAAAGILEVRTSDGRLFDLETMKPGKAAPAPLPPHPIPDSLANDTPTGYTLPRYPGENPLNPEQAAAVVEGMASVDAPPGVETVQGEMLVTEDPPPLGEPLPGNLEYAPGAEEIPPPPALEATEMEDEEADVEHVEKSGSSKSKKNKNKKP